MISRGIGKGAARSVARSLLQFGSGGGGVAPSYDTDAQTYITAVEAADGQSLETGVKDAINAFVVGCKADGIWTAIKASCILAGARTLTGALVPLVGTAPTNNNFVSGDYSRTAGLTGNGSTKYLDSNRAANSDPQDNAHISAYATTSQNTANALIGGDYLGWFSAMLNASTNAFVRINNSVSTAASFASAGLRTGLWGASRSSSATYNYIIGSNSVASNSIASGTPPSANYLLFVYDGSSTKTFYSTRRIAFYSIGESLDLALLDSRVTTLITNIGTALA